MMRSGLVHEKRVIETPEWYTPREVFHGMVGTKFDLDPCSPGKHVVPWIPAAEHLTKEQDGLRTPWDGKSVWMNPPYGNETGLWTEKACRHARNGGTVAALLFARTDTAWFHDMMSGFPQAQVLFLKSRIRFMKPDGSRGGSPGCGSMLVLMNWGDRKTPTLDHVRMTAT